MGTGGCLFLQLIFHLVDIGIIGHRKINILTDIASDDRTQ